MTLWTGLNRCQKDRVTFWFPTVITPPADSVEYFPQYEDYMDNILKHYHIGRGGQVMPIPESLHEGSGGIHNIE